MNILQITSSIRGNDSESTRVANLIVNKLVSSNPDAKLVRRDFGAQPHPLLDGPAVGALFTPAGQRSSEQASRVALDDALIAEAQAADVIVI
ncbi:MAG: FMN-dependent NADH-azoreductase, partial [Lysobacteraceae bacterium]